MKAQIPDNEKRLQEKILAHRVPFEEQAWDAMDALLDGETGKKAPAEPPAPQETPAPSNKSRKFFILLFLLSAVAVFSAKIGLNILENRKAATMSSVLSTSENNMAETTPPIFLSTSETTTSTGPENNNSSENTTPKDGQKTNKAGSSTEKSISFDAKQGSVGKRPVESDQRWVVGPAKVASSHLSGTTEPGLPKQTSSGSDQTTNAFQSALTGGTETRLPTTTSSGSDQSTNASQSVVTGEKATDLSDDSKLVAPLKAINILAFLPLLPPDSLKTDRDLPEAETVPVKNKIRRNLQRGWILGGNLSFVDYQPLYLNLMPVVGYHVAFPVQKGFVQTGVQVTGATGYNQKTEFIYSAPGGSLDIDVSLKNLMFIEVPLVYQRAFTGNKRQFWLAGIRTAVVVPVDNYVSNAGSISGSIFPSANIDLSDGVRWFDLGLTVGWQWRFSERWAMDLRFTQGLMDLTHDNFFNNTETTLNSDFQLTFRHYVSTFK